MYLMIPLARRHSGLPWPDNKASVSEWTIAESLEVAEDCENADFFGPFYITTAGEATCIATDDPRLKEDSAIKSSDARPLAAD